MKRVQQIHLYLGVLFAPLILFFAFSGMLMVFHFNDQPKGGSYVPPMWIKVIADIHKNARRSADNSVPPSWPLKWFVASMAVGLIVTTLLGIYMACKYRRQPWMIAGLIAAGILLPIGLLYAV